MKAKQIQRFKNRYAFLWNVLCAVSDTGCFINLYEWDSGHRQNRKNVYLGLHYHRKGRTSFFIATKQLAKASCTNILVQVLQMSIWYLCGTRYGILYLQSTEIGNVCVRTRCKIKEGIGRMLIKSINDPTATKKTVRLSLYYPEIWDAYQSLVFETVVNGPHQEPEGPQILESMNEK